MVWVIDFQFDSTIDGKAVKIASMLDEHTRESLLHVGRSITAERLVIELEDTFGAAGGPPKMLRMGAAKQIRLTLLLGAPTSRVRTCCSNTVAGTRIGSRTVRCCRSRYRVHQ